MAVPTTGMNAAIAEYDRSSENVAFVKLEQLLRECGGAARGVEIVEIRVKRENGLTRLVLLSGSWFRGKYRDEYCVEGRLFTKKPELRSTGLEQLTGVHNAVYSSRLVRLAHRTVSGEALYFSDLRSVTKLSPTYPVYTPDGGLHDVIDRYDQLVLDYPSPNDGGTDDSYRNVQYVMFKRVGMLRAAAEHAEKIVRLMKRFNRHVEVVRIPDFYQRLHDVLLIGRWEDAERRYVIVARLFPSRLEDLAGAIATSRTLLGDRSNKHIIMSKSRLVESVRSRAPEVEFVFHYVYPNPNPKL